MKWQIPGTLLECERQEADRLEERFSFMHSYGGLSMCHITEITGLETYMVQNWVKRGFLPPPQNRRYDLQQLCRIIIINMLRGVFPMEKICAMLSYVNGRLDDTADDIIPDCKLYFMFVSLAARAKELDNDPEELLDRTLADYVEPYPGAKERVRRVLKIMITGYLACRMGQEAEKQMEALMEGEMNHER